MSFIMLNCDVFVIRNHFKMSQFCIMNDILNDKKPHNIVNDSFAHKPDSLFVKNGGYGNKW